MDAQDATLNSAYHGQTHGITAAPTPNMAGTEKKLNTVTSEEDEIRQMTLNTANTSPKPAQSQSTGIVTKQPSMVQNMKPENYVVKPENLGESPDYIDCPYCKSRQKTEVRHQSTSQTSLAAAVCCLCCGILPVFIPFVCNWCSDLDHHCESCKKRVAHQPHEGKMEAVLPPVSAATTGADSRYQLSQYADMSKQSQQKLEPTIA
ncbi:hypothetical protein TRIATDRAFT_84172 [Trichoderma atroviride IMI 206040]|uniref:LITAF domain-containing protein n=1 Tax=Hypocrea atroviridis (strain ATCC 20476 / IMI 206040) TaxID=452589 RepID=G9P544_HYPAI|nr:uncharacterized protein TRIATDRAFT_84172 [Trichoderma atroviride IMI 206040]EHK42070.1 hypothetical protein TRIATDRAFT_84172 [Trichoderma atroviride IMI 206040]